jgi:hypothetical protein
MDARKGCGERNRDQSDVGPQSKERGQLLDGETGKHSILPRRLQMGCNPDAHF